MAEGMVRVKTPDAANRCQAIAKHGQCWFERVEGSTTCKIHAGGHASSKTNERSKRTYRLGIYQEEFDNLMESGRIKHLYEEIVLIKVLVQAHLNVIGASETEMLRLSPVICNHVNMLEKLIKSCDLMERQAGQLLDKSRAQVLGQEIAELVAKFVPEPHVMLKIGEGIGEILNRLDLPNVPK